MTKHNITKFEYKKEDVAEIYDELERRVQFDDLDIVVDSKRHGKHFTPEFASMLQGAYSVMMLTAKNWHQVFWWITDIEEERYFPKKEGCEECQI